MKSICRSFLIVSGVLAALTVVQPALHAQGFGGDVFSSFFSKDDDKDNEYPIDTSADGAMIDLEKNVITLLGNVVVDRNDTRIKCDSMTIYLKDKSEEPSDADKEKTDKEKETKTEAKPAVIPAGGSAEQIKNNQKEDKDDDDGMKQNISQIVCSGNVVYRQKKTDNPLEDSIALAAKGDYDDATGVIIMSGGHINPKAELSEAVYNDIVRRVGKDMAKEYPIMKQGTTWIIGDEIKISDPKHMYVINPKATSNKSISTNSSNPGSTR